MERRAPPARRNVHAFDASPAATPHFRILTAQWQVRFLTFRRAMRTYVGNMADQEINANERERFFATFNRLHHGAPVTLRVDAAEVVGDQPFRGVSCEGTDLVVHVGSGPDRDQLALRVPYPGKVRLEQTDDGADAALDITSNDGEHTVVRFRWPMRPELLDPAVE